MQIPHIAHSPEFGLTPKGQSQRPQDLHPVILKKENRPRAEKKAPSGQRYLQKPLETTNISISMMKIKKAIPSGCGIPEKSRRYIIPKGQIKQKTGKCSNRLAIRTETRTKYFKFINFLL